MKRYFLHFNLFDLLYFTVCVLGIVVFYPNLLAMVGIAVLILFELAVRLFFHQLVDRS